MKLSHRVLMSPLTRARCPGSIPTPLVEEYYAQRATEGGLLISEGMHPSLMVRPPCPSLAEILSVLINSAGRKLRRRSRHVCT